MQWSGGEGEGPGHRQHLHIHLCTNTSPLNGRSCLWKHSFSLFLVNISLNCCCYCTSEMSPLGGHQRPDWPDPKVEGATCPPDAAGKAAGASDAAERLVNDQPSSRRCWPTPSRPAPTSVWGGRGQELQNSPQREGEELLAEIGAFEEGLRRRTNSPE